MPMNRSRQPVLVAILGPTAGGKTRLAALLAHRLDGEILSADSRQVFAGMDIGTGKDLQDYVVGGRRIPVHLLDIRRPGEPFSLFDWVTEYVGAVQEILSRQRLPILCGGSGMYLEAALQEYRLVPAPRDPELRRELADLDFRQLADRLARLKTLHNTTDLTNRETLVRAIEVAEYTKRHPERAIRYPPLHKVVFGLSWPRRLLRHRIRRRLRERLGAGLLTEVRRLLASGVAPEVLRSYGLEYRYTLDYIYGHKTKHEMEEELYRAICQFAKRQETWFRRMERRGTKIHWLDGTLGPEANLAAILERLQRESEISA